MLWAHVDVLRTVKDGNPTPSAFWLQSRDWNPAITDQPDDYLDAVAGAVTETPERIKGKVGKPTAGTAHDWRPTGGTHEVAFERKGDGYGTAWRSEERRVGKECGVQCRSRGAL